VSVERSDSVVAAGGDQGGPVQGLAHDGSGVHDVVGIVSVKTYQQWLGGILKHYYRKAA
jgi:hypothetical protein